MTRKSRENFTDVIIIGAGPAGAIAAYTLAEAGINIVMFEKKKVVGVPSHCAEGISHYVLDFLNVNDRKEWIVKTMKGTKIFFPNQKFLYYPGRSYSIDRTLFDQELVENAIKKGARLLLQRRVVGVEKNTGRWLVTTADGKVFTCKYLIAADGATSTVRRLLGIGENFILAIHYKFSPIEKFEDEYFVFYNNEKHHPGYAWIFSRGIETSIGIGGVGNVKKKLEDLLQSLDIDPSTRKSVHSGCIPHLTKPMLIALPDVLFAGDAGGFTCPLTGAGIIGALISGRAAGEVIRDAIIEEKADILSTYPERVRSHPSRSGVTLFYCHKFFSLSNNSLNAIGEVIDQRIYSDIPIIDAFRYFSKKPHWQTMSGLIIGFAAQQILNYFKKYVF